MSYVTIFIVVFLILMYRRNFVKDLSAIGYTIDISLVGVLVISVILVIVGVLPLV